MFHRTQTRTAVSPAEPMSRHKTQQNIPQKTLALTLFSLAGLFISNPVF